MVTLCSNESPKKIRKLLRSEQVFARVGGEEFVALLPETSGENGLQLAEKLREVVAEKPFHYAGLDVPVTSSFGVSELAVGFETPEALYEAADRALYHSKQNGRNLVTMYDPETHGPIVTPRVRLAEPVLAVPSVAHGA